MYEETLKEELKWVEKQILWYQGQIKWYKKYVKANAEGIETLGEAFKDDKKRLKHYYYKRHKLEKQLGYPLT